MGLAGRVPTQCRSSPTLKMLKYNKTISFRWQLHVIAVNKQVLPKPALFCRKNALPASISAQFPPSQRVADSILQMMEGLRNGAANRVNTPHPALLLLSLCVCSVIRSLGPSGPDRPSGLFLRPGVNINQS